MFESWMLARLKRETEPFHNSADADRLMAFAITTTSAYRTFLARVYGFESPVEAAVAMTSELAPYLDVRGRTQIKLLRADLAALGVLDLAALPRCTKVSPFRSAAAAAGWLYVIERNTLAHGVIERQLRMRLPEPMKIAGTYLGAPERSVGARRRELGEAMDRIGKTTTVAAEIVEAARAAFRCQRAWYRTVVPERSPGTIGAAS